MNNFAIKNTILTSLTLLDSFPIFAIPVLDIFTQKFLATMERKLLLKVFIPPGLAHVFAGPLASWVFVVRVRFVGLRKSFTLLLSRFGLKFIGFYIGNASSVLC